MSSDQKQDQRHFGDLLGDREYMAARAEELSRKPTSTVTEPTEPVGVLRGIAAITGEPFDGLRADFEKGGPLARALSKLLAIHKQGRGNPRPGRTTEYWLVVGILKAAGLKGAGLKRAIIATANSPRTNVDTWMKGYWRGRQEKGEVDFQRVRDAASANGLVWRALEYHPEWLKLILMAPFYSL